MLKALSRPFRRYFNSRFESIASDLRQVQYDLNLLSSKADAVPAPVPDVGEQIAAAVVNSTTTITDLIDASHVDALATASLLGRRIDMAVDGVDILLDRTDPESDRTSELIENAIALHIAAQGSAQPGFDPQIRGAVTDLTADDAAIANYAASHVSWASQSGVWFNPPISVAHAAGGVHVADVNERVAEIPFLFRALSLLQPGSRVLDVGSTESTVAVSLASLGYRVTAVDPRPYPLAHRNLRVHVGLIEEFDDDTPYDAAVLLSSIEHFGVGAYDLPEAGRADRMAMRKVVELVRPGGLLVLTTPYGIASANELERTYSPQQLDELLEGWNIVERSYLTRTSPTEWVYTPLLQDLSGDHVVLVSATKIG